MKNFSSLATPVVCLAALLVLFACKGKDKAVPEAAATMSTSGNLKLVARHHIDVEEPSDLDLSEDRKTLWTVSDEGGIVYQMDLNGHILGSFGSGLEDLEGVTTVGHKGLAVVSEKSREIVLMTSVGKHSSRSKLDMPGERNKGPESLTYDPVESVYYALKEKTPGTLITLDASLRETSRAELNFAKDYSSMSYDPVRGHLWVMSDESDAVYVLDRDLRIQTIFSFDIEQPEGLAVDYEARKMWVVCDKSSILYTFTFSDY
ncbi:SdiA-regulated domain-containing protein [Luteolibacter sp. SL250]|uniref:SdiA-regulated domain-containing protein n=1 Tax=Luteolibacter sp. SL250 TaxID=2995170 RepID=UPI00226F9F86|nr:SdiA-regulated domain-containing protein [Luteolibacter sp. SL250]WAC19780.1 SdiA-regulated domain-containing protein [Luteolibacter sp. SL250]